MIHLGKKTQKYIILVTGLLFLFYVLFRIHVAIFHKSYEFMYYLIMDIAFLPIEVLLLSLVVEKIIAEREKRAIVDKMMMVVGVFFNEVGTQLLQRFATADTSLTQLHDILVISVTTDDASLKKLKRSLRDYTPTIDIEKIDLLNLKNDLIEKREFLIKLLENPVLLEHDEFTDLLQAVFHLEEEISRRKNIQQLHHHDKEHINADIDRAYRSLLFAWGDYMGHLKKNYPYLYSFAVRTNPFNENARIEID